MTFSSSPADPGPVVADASVIINLNATGSAAAIIGAVPNRFLVTSDVGHELAAGMSHGHRTGQRLEALARDGVLDLVELDAADRVAYRSIMTAGREARLQHGEAATIAYATGHGGIALTDERKARRMCSAHLPDLPLASSVELLLHPAVAERLGEEGQNEAIFRALRDARMHVHRRWLSEVVGRIGADRASECPSLPRSFRESRPAGGRSGGWSSQ